MNTNENELYERERRRSEAIADIQSRIDEIEALQRDYDSLSAQALITGGEAPAEPDADELPTLKRRLQAVVDAADPELEELAGKALGELNAEADKLRKRIDAATDTASAAWQAYRETVEAGQALNDEGKQLSRRVARVRDITKVKRSVGIPTFRMQ